MDEKQILCHKLYDILDETIGHLTSEKLQKLTLDLNQEKISLYEIRRYELGLIADSTSYIMLEIEFFQSELLNIIQKNKRLFNNILTPYEDFLFFTAKLVQELSLPNNSISASKIISMLFERGYLSKNSRFLTTSEETYPDIPGYMGLNVINGAGCCRHISDIHKRIFNYLGLLDIEISGTHSDSDTLSEVFDTTPNHLVNLIQFNGKYYIHDLLFRTIGYFENSFSLIPYPKNIPYHFYYKPTENMIFNNLSQKETIQRVIEFQEDSKKSPISLKELNEILEETEDNFYYHLNLLNDFEIEKRKYIQKMHIR